MSRDISILILFRLIPASRSTQTALSISAIQEHERTGKGQFVNYKQLPSFVWQTLLPSTFGVSPVNAEMIGNMQQLAGVYSSFYNADKVMVDDASVRARRLLLCARTRTILITGLELLGIQPLERM